MSEQGDGGFLSRWSRRKVQSRSGVVMAKEEVSAPVVHPHPDPPPAERETEPVAAPVEPDRPPPPTLDDVAALTPTSDFSRFVAADVDPGVRNAALKKLFADPHYNVMDGLDIYIDDYGKPDPIPPEMLRQMVQSKFLGLFDDEEEKTEPAPEAIAHAEPAPLPAPDNPRLDEDTDLRLQPDDAARCGSADEGAGPREG